MGDDERGAGDRCVFCDLAFAVPDGKGGVTWIITPATPHCDHETIGGRR